MVSAFHLQDNGVLGAWKLKLLKMGFKVQVFEMIPFIIPV